MNKKASRLKRALKLRSNIRKLGSNRLTVHKTSKHIYAQVITENGTVTVASACTTQAEVKSAVKSTGNVESAVLVGKLVADKAIAAGITEVTFDRSGFKYHGRVKALADAAREAGLKF
jgi:large subunit ribosomal protein L18